MDKQTVDEIRAWLADEKAVEPYHFSEYDAVIDRLLNNAAGVDWLTALLAYYDDNEARKQADSGG